LRDGKEGADMNEELKPEMPSMYIQHQERLVSRLQPDSEFEENLVRQLVLCHCKLEQIQNRLTKAWCQFNKIYDEMKYER
jgi:hypothetical protein